MSRTNNRAIRLIRLMALLQDQWLSTAALAGATGWSQRTIERDIYGLEELGYPVEKEGVCYRRMRTGNNAYARIMVHEEPVIVAQRMLRAMLLLHDTWRGTGDLARLLGCSRGSAATVIAGLGRVGYVVERRRFAGQYVWRRAPETNVFEAIIMPAA